MIIVLITKEESRPGIGRESGREGETEKGEGESGGREKGRETQRERGGGGEREREGGLREREREGGRERERGKRERGGWYTVNSVVLFCILLKI